MSLLPGFSKLLSFVVRQGESGCVGSCVSKWKAGFAAILLVEGLVFGCLVYLLRRFSTSPKKFNVAAHLGNALSAGVFFATGALHILPETVELISGEHGHGEEEHEEGAEAGAEEEQHEEGEEEEEIRFPWAYFIVMISFYGIFFIERILVPKILGRRAKGTCHADLDLDEEKVEDIASSQRADEDESDKMGAESSKDVSSSDEADKEATGKGFASEEFVVGLIQILGISAHSFFESMALGLSSQFSTVLNIFIATAAHRWATALAIGFRLVKALKFFPFLVLLILFSLMVPLGIGIGAALTSLSQTTQGILFGISAGTFIYIGVFEAMAEEYVVHKKWQFRKFLFTLSGVALISIVTGILVAEGVHG